MAEPMYTRRDIQALIKRLFVSSRVLIDWYRRAIQFSLNEEKVGVIGSVKRCVYHNSIYWGKLMYETSYEDLPLKINNYPINGVAYLTLKWRLEIGK